MGNVLEKCCNQLEVEQPSGVEHHIITIKKRESVHSRKSRGEKTPTSRHSKTNTGGHKVTPKVFLQVQQEFLLNNKDQKSRGSSSSSSSKRPCTGDTNSLRRKSRRKRIDPFNDDSDCSPAKIQANKIGSTFTRLTQEQKEERKRQFKSNHEYLIEPMRRQVDSIEQLVEDNKLGFQPIQNSNIPQNNESNVSPHLGVPSLHKQTSAIPIPNNLQQQNILRTDSLEYAKSKLHHQQIINQLVPANLQKQDLLLSQKQIKKRQEDENLKKRFSAEDIKKVYKMGKVIGKGKFGCVRTAFHYSNPQKKLAIKSIFREAIESNIHLVELEHDIMKDVDHPNIVKIYETYMDKLYFHFVMEFCEGGDLFDKIQSKGKFTETEAACVIEQILSALNHCHYKNISHRDLKPENIVFKRKTVENVNESSEDFSEEGEIKIIDFGLAKYLGGDNTLKSKVGTPYYVAPEVLEGNYDNRCDIWSVGVIAYTLLCGYPPFFADNHQEIFTKIKNCDYEYNTQDWESVSYNARQFIDSLIVKDVDKRSTAEEALQHPWLRYFNHERLEKTPTTWASPLILQRLKNYKKPRLIKREAMKILLRVIEEKQMSHLKHEFQNLDRKKKGVLDVETLRVAFKEKGYDLNDSEIEDMIKKIKREDSEEEKESENFKVPQIVLHSFSLKPSQNNEEKSDEEQFTEQLVFQRYKSTQPKDSEQSVLAYSDFLMATFDLKSLSKTELWTVFKHLDTENKGKLTYKSLLKAFKRTSRGQNCEKNAMALMYELDLAKEDEITFEKFVTLITAQNSANNSYIQSPRLKTEYSRDTF